MNKRMIVLFFLIIQLFLASCSPETKQKNIELPYYGAYIVSEGSKVTELFEFRGEPNSNQLMSQGVPVYKLDEEILILIWYSQINLDYFMFGSMEPKEERLPYKISPWNEEVLQLIPSNELTDGIYCFAQGGPLASPIDVPFWCFRIGDNDPQEIQEQEFQYQEQIIQEKQDESEDTKYNEKIDNIVRVMDYCSIYGKSPIEISRNDEVVIFDGWMAKEKELVIDHIVNVILEISLDGERILFDYISEIVPDYDNNNNIEGYDVYFEKNVGTLSPGAHRVEAIVSWDQKIFDGWAFYGPGTTNETIEGHCEIIVE